MYFFLNQMNKTIYTNGKEVYSGNATFGILNLSNWVVVKFLANNLRNRKTKNKV